MSDEPETPQYVINEWLKQCHCCPECYQMSPCNGVMAGSMCDNACDCNDDYDETDGCCLHGIGFDEYCEDCEI